MKRLIRLCVVLVFSFFVLMGQGDVYADKEEKDKKEPVLKPSTFEIDGRKYEAYVYWVDMNDKRNYVDIGLANDKIGSTESLLSIAKRAESSSADDKVLAAINGTFFNMQVNSSPINSIMKDGRLKYLGTWASLATFDGDNNMNISRPVFKVFGSINDQWDWPYGFIAKTINKFSEEQYGVAIIDSSFKGSVPDDIKYVVAVQNREVVGVYDKMPSEIPKDGYLLASRVRFTKTDINVGDSVDYVYRSFSMDDQSEMLSFYNVRTALGAGPTLVKDGKIALDLQKEGFAGWSIYNDRQRSMVGMTKDKKMAFVVTKSMSLNALSKLAVKLGMENAMNLDGGGSAGLVVGSEYAMQPLRAVSNSLIIKQRKMPSTRIVINQVEHFFDTEPYIYKSRTMVPLRGILESLGSQLTWDDKNGLVIVERYGKKLIFKRNSTTVRGEDRTYEMDVPLLIKNGRSAISLRFLGEFLGGIVEWHAEDRIAEIRIETVKDQYELGKSLYDGKKYDLALKYFDNVLRLNSKHIAALKYVGNIYNIGLKDYRRAADYYKRVLELYDDKDVNLDLMECYIHDDNIDAAVELNEALEKKSIDGPRFFYFSAKAYENIDRAKAYAYFTKLIELRKHKDAEYDWLKEADSFVFKYRKTFEKAE